MQPAFSADASKPSAERCSSIQKKGRGRVKNILESKFSEIFTGESEMAGIMRKHDWGATPLGDPTRWPDALKIPLRMLLTSKFEMWLGWGPDLNFFYNDAYTPTLGTKHGKALGCPFREVWSEVYDDVADQVEKVRSGEATWNKALLLLLERSGYPEETYHSFSYSPLHDADGAVVGLLCVVSEDTGRVIGERRLETLHRLGAGLVGAADEAAVFKAARSALASNRRDYPFAALRLSADEQIAGYGNDDDDLARLFEPDQHLTFDIKDGGHVFELCPDTIWPAGDWDRPPQSAFSIAISGATEKAAAGSLILGLNPYRSHDPDILNLARLIAAQINGALTNVAAIQAERRRADRMWAYSRDLMVVIDGEGKLCSVSPAWSQMLGHPESDVLGRPFLEFVYCEDRAENSDALERARANEQLTNYENRFLTADGGFRWIDWHTSTEDGLVYGYGRDITERHLAEEALSKSQEQFRYLVQGVTDYAIYLIDLNGHVSSWNEGARRIKGYEPEEIIGEHFSQFYTEEDRARGEPEHALETARKEGRFLAEGWRVRKSGERFRASIVIDLVRNDEGEPIGFAKITRDIAERHEAQRELEQAREALSQSQKMDAIGQLTGGVAHDFNNLLMAVLGSLELLRRRLPDDPFMLRLLDNAVEGAQRGATLTQRMLAFARRQHLTVDRVDVSRLLSGMGDLVQRSIGPEWPISTNLPLGLHAIRADANQLEMALINLIVNARDASPAGGPIVVSASLEDVAARPTHKLAAGSYVRLVVTDTGSGMDEETLRRATEPFFTTKGVGKGTGLGLPMVHGMAQQIGGGFELVSRIGGGTSAILWLPVAPQDETVVVSVTPDQEPPATTRLKILVVDDDALVLMNTAALLEDLGHEVVEAASGEEALEKFRERNDIDMVITDQAMPHLTGNDLLAAIERVRAGVPAIIASGYGEGAGGERLEVVHLNKPFNQAHLARAIAEALDRAD